MSLDVYLKVGTDDECPHCYGTGKLNGGEVCVYDSHITHNLGAMAREAGIYEHLWRPEDVGITRAEELIEPLRVALTLMRSDPQRFQKHNASNGWGDYEGFYIFVARYLDACIQYPGARVLVSR